MFSQVQSKLRAQILKWCKGRERDGEAAFVLAIAATMVVELFFLG
jgi:hypothetical protein